MFTLNQTDESPVVRGIKTVGVGKKGSKSLNLDLAHEILADLRSRRISSLAQGAFLGALFVKGVSLDELILDQAFKPGTLRDPGRLVETIASDAPKIIKKECINLLNKKQLNKEEAYWLGKFLLSDEPGEAARGLAASVLRVRYESLDEYEGLLQALNESMEAPFHEKVPEGSPIIQLAEPFDGVDHSYLTTPLLAECLKQLNYKVVSLIGRNSGPKKGNNLLDLVNALGISFTKSNHELGEKPSLYGWYIRQADLSKPLDAWVERRREIVKRPCFATLEKFLNPAKAQIIITSAFHPSYGEKMASIAERAGFPGSIVIRNGLEGSLTFPLKRAVKILCSARLNDGTYHRHEITFDPAEYLGINVPVDEKLNEPSLAENAKLIQQFIYHRKSSNERFNLRIKAAHGALSEALRWIETALRKNRA